MGSELRKVEKLGGEGLMIRKPGSKYEHTRSHDLLKIKTFHDAEVRSRFRLDLRVFTVWFNSHSPNVILIKSRGSMRLYELFTAILAARTCLGGGDWSREGQRSQCERDGRAGVSHGVRQTVQGRLGLHRRAAPQSAQERHHHHVSLPGVHQQRLAALPDLCRSVEIYFICGCCY